MSSFITNLHILFGHSEWNKKSNEEANQGCADNVDKDNKDDPKDLDPHLPEPGVDLVGMETIEKTNVLARKSIEQFVETWLGKQSSEEPS